MSRLSGPPNTAPANADSIDSSDLVVTHGGTSSAGETIVGSGDIYTVTVTGIAGDGSFTLAVSTASDVHEVLDNPLASSMTSANRLCRRR